MARTTAGGASFSFLARIDSNGGRFRVHAAIGTFTNAGGGALAPGIYMAVGQSPCEANGGPPEILGGAEAGGSIAPILVIYRRME